MRRLLFGILSCIAWVPLSAHSVEFRAVETAAVLYDAPSQRGIKLFVIRRGTPVEVVVSLEGWAKVRDSEGGLAWIEKRYLSPNRSVVVKIGQADVLKKAEDGSERLFSAEQGVGLEYLDTLPGGWIKVRHHAGQEGFVRAGQVWGF